MGDIFLCGILAVLAGYYGYVIVSHRRRRGPQVQTENNDLGTQLFGLSAKITAFAKKTVHARELLRCPDFCKAVELLGKADFDIVRQYALAADPQLAAAALEALSSHAERQKAFDPVIIAFRDMPPMVLHFALRYFVSLESRPPVGGPAVVALAWWCNSIPHVESFKDYFVARKKLGDAPEFGTYLDWSMCAPPLSIQNFLGRIEHPYAVTLRAQLDRWSATRLDRKFLTIFGRLWEGASDADAPIETPQWTPLLDQAEQAVFATPPHSILVSGEPRIGKTAFLLLLGERLKRRGWRVFEAGAADLMAGQSYFGELEGRIRQTVAELAASKHVVWYVGDLLQLAESGTHRGQSASVLDQILPAVLDGRLVVLAEASPEGVSRLFQGRPSLRTQMEVHKLQPFTPDEVAWLARHVAQALAERSDIAIADDAVQAALQLSQQYLGASPGLVVDLVKRAVQHAAAAGAPSVTPHSMMMALSQITGLPAAILDDSERVDLAGVREFFSNRIIGQTEAVGAIVDRIAMLKAGLTDPDRPVGVFLFAGPTGTGKTELAKTLAAYLFGSPNRMARLDMSEFQSPDSISKILGERGFFPASDPLVERVRKQPFSVILLDEFEKAHPNVWDLFLQIFDDGRLADANGRVADFRHTIIILTSNLGANDHRDAGIGFLPSKGSYADNQVTQAVARTFRPEFINRLDKIVVFQPLSRELMRRILHKELEQVLERRGLRNRDWVVEWEQSAVEFLLDKGFSPSMGARPLKRAIDQYLLAPLAATLVEHRFPQGDQFLFVRSNGQAIQVEFVDPDAEPLPPPPEVGIRADAVEISPAGMILQPRGSDDERAALNQHYSALVARLESPQWQDLKEAALARATAPEIWSDPGRHAIFARVALLDRLGEAMRTAERLKYRLDGRTVSRELVARLALQLFLIEAGITDVMTNAPVDAVISISPVLEGHSDSGQTAHWCERLAHMYRRWAEHRHMQTGELAPPAGETPLIPISGFGAFRILSQEAGLHVLEQEHGRLTARVTVVPGPAQEPRPDQAWRAYADLLARAEKSMVIVRRYREDPAPLVRDARAGWRSGRLDLVLDGNFDLLGEISVRG